MFKLMNHKDLCTDSLNTLQAASYREGRSGNINRPMKSILNKVQLASDVNPRACQRYVQVGRTPRVHINQPV